MKTIITILTLLSMLVLAGCTNHSSSNKNKDGAFAEHHLYDEMYWSVQNGEEKPLEFWLLKSDLDDETVKEIYQLTHE